MTNPKNGPLRPTLIRSAVVAGILLTVLGAAFVFLKTNKPLNEIPKSASLELTPESAPSEMRLIGPNLIRNPDFQNDLEGWKKEDGSGKMQSSVEERHGHRALRMTVERPAPKGWPHFMQPLNLTPGKAYSISLEMDTVDAGGGAGPYYCVEYLNAAGQRIGLANGTPAVREGAWNPSMLNLVVPPDAVAMRLQLILHGHGTVWWRNVSVREIDQAATATLNPLVTAKVAPQPNARPLLGIGYEDDGTAYSDRNLSFGITPEELRLREERIRFLQADNVRMFIYMNEWLPKDYYRTTPVPENLLRTAAAGNDVWRSRLKSLEQYQAMGIPVNLTGVEIGGTGWLGPMWRDPEIVATAYADLLEYLVKEKGFTCIRYFTLNNEPNTAFMTDNEGTFEAYVAIHRLLREKLNARNLDIALVGCDDANSFHFFAECLGSEDMRNASGLWASHMYPSDYLLNRRGVAELLDARMDLINRKSPGKDLIIAEFGFSASGSSSSANPVMQTYDYALFTTDFILRGLARGVTGFNIWVLHQVYYPEGVCGPIMSYGLWPYRTQPGKVFPVFHAMANLTRHTQKGDLVTPLAVNGEKVSACKVGNHIFWANLRETPVTFRVEGVPLVENRAYTEASLVGEEECGQLVKVEGNDCELPPRSFGRIEVANH